MFEGVDGSGKTTLLQGLAKRLNSAHIPVITTREPGGTPLAESLRNLVLSHMQDAPVDRAELLIYEASRAQHVEKLIRPALNQGQWVLCDRFTASSVAFQGSGRNIQSDQVHWLNEFATGGLKPDLTVLVDVSIDVSLQRQTTRGKADRIESQPKDFHERVRNSFLSQAQQSAPGTWLVLDGNHSPQELQDQLWNHLKDLKWISS